MKTSLTLPRTNRPPKADPFLPAAIERTKAAVKRLQDAGIIDAEGRRIRTDTPPDMREDADRDFGG